MGSNTFAVEITVRGRVGAATVAMVGPLEADVVPRHTVVRVTSGDLADLRAVLSAMERHGLQVERILRPGAWRSPQSERAWP